MQQLRTELRAEIREGVAGLRDHFDVRFDDASATRDRMHGDNLTVLREIRAEARETNGRVTALEVLYRAIVEQFAALKKSWHDFRDSLQAQFLTLMTKRGSDAPASGENRHLTMRDMYVFVGGLGSFYFIAKVFKWLP